MANKATRAQCSGRHKSAPTSLGVDFAGHRKPGQATDQPKPTQSGIHRVLPPQPDQVVVTDFVATTICFLNQVFHVYAIPCRTDGESFGITGGYIIVCNFGFVMIVYA